MQQLQKPKQGYKLVKSLFGKYEEIPEEWNKTKLIHLCAKKPEYGANVPAIKKDERLPRYIRITDLNDDGSLRNYEWKSIEEKDSAQFLLSEGEILFARTGATVGKTYLYHKEHGKCAFAGYLIRFIPDSSKLNGKFLFHYTHSERYWRWLKSIQTWGVQPNVNAEQYSNMLLLLPVISEQQKIASILSNVDSLIQQTQRIIEQTQNLKKGLMQKLLTKGIGHTKFKQLDIFPRHLKFDIPESWEVVNFGDVSERITYGFTNPMPSTDNGPWMITATNIKNGRIDYTTARQTDWKSYKELLSDKSRPKIGTVLITKDGTLGEVAIVDNENLCINQSVASLEPKKSKITSEFLSMILQSTLTKKLIDVFSPATTIRHISITDLAEWKLGLPPADEQQKIVSILNMCELSLQHVKNYMCALQTLKKGLMQKLLTGQIRVKV